MGRGEEFTARHHNKAARKRLRADAVELGAMEGRAAKKRRKQGNRRITEGMCYSLPTPENPFNEPDLKNDINKLKFRPEANKPLKTPVLSSNKARANIKDKKTSPTAVLRKVFWPLGLNGSESLQGEDDPRLTQTFRTAFTTLSEGQARSRPSGTVRMKSSGSTDAARGDLEGSLSAGLCDNEVDERGGPSGITTWQQLQRQSWEGCLRGRDVVVSLPTYDQPEIECLAAMTFGPPLAVHVHARGLSKPGQGPLALVVVPTIERARKLRQVLKKLKESLGLRSMSLHEGTDMDQQAAGLESQAVELVVGTCTRITALVDSGCLSLSQVSFLVLEAADLVVATEGTKQLLEISRQVRVGRQAVLLTSTWGAGVLEVAQSWLREPLFRAVGDSSPVSACAGLSLAVDVYGNVDKRLAKVVALLERSREEEKNARTKRRTLVIATDAPVAAMVATELLRGGHKVALLHLDLSHADQEAAEIDFRVGKAALMVATGEACRLHAVKLGTVRSLVLYDFPSSCDAFYKLAGSISRSSLGGRVHAFLPQSLPHLAPHLVRFLQALGQDVGSSLEMLARAYAIVQSEQASLSKTKAKSRRL